MLFILHSPIVSAASVRVTITFNNYKRELPQKIWKEKGLDNEFMEEKALKYMSLWILSPAIFDFYTVKQTPHLCGMHLRLWEKKRYNLMRSAFGTKLGANNRIEASSSTHNL